MKKTLFFCLSVFSFLIASCESNEEADSFFEKGKMMIDLSSDMSYKSSKGMVRSLDLTPYENVGNYTVEIKDDVSGEIIQSKLYSETQLVQELKPSTYTVRAFYGENVNAAYDKLYMEGKQSFQLLKGDNKKVSFVCVPANVKVNLKFSEDFNTYYSACTVGFKTQYLPQPFTMNQADTDKDLFLKAAAGEQLTLSFELKDKNGIVVTPSNFGSKTLTVNPRDFLTVTVKPQLVNIDGGKISGIIVTIDNGVQDEIIDVVLPDEFLPGEDTTVNN